MPQVNASLMTRHARWMMVCGALFGATVIGWSGVGCSNSNDSGSPASGTGGTSAGSGGRGDTTLPPASSGGAGPSTGAGGANAAGGTGMTAASGGTTAAGGAGASGTAAGGNTGNGGNANAGGRSAGDGGNGVGAGGAAVGAGGSTHTGIWKVMPFGDSVTGSTCYPQMLSKDLIAAGHRNFQFVGTVTNNRADCGTATPSVKTEGHGGYGVTFLPSTSTRPRCTKQAQGCGSYAELQTWAAEKPDIVLMHFATNDVWDGEPTQLILSAYLAVIAEFRKQNPNVVFFVSKIIPLVPAPANAVALNAAVTPIWASTNSTATSPIHIIDHWTGFNAATDTADGVHPTPAGAQKMSTASVAALSAAAYF